MELANVVGHSRRSWSWDSLEAMATAAVDVLDRSDHEFRCGALPCKESDELLLRGVPQVQM